MWNTIKSWFVPSEGFGGFVSNEGTREMTATITPTSNGTFALVDRTGTVVGTYTRERDAKRGATRRGLILA